MQLSLLSPPTSSSSLGNMEFSEEVIGTAHHEGSFPIAKGIRSKRQRLLLPMTSSSSTGGGGSEDNHLPSPATSAAEHSEATTEEDEDMANCLMLLAQGGVSEYDQKLEVPQLSERQERFSSRRLAETATTTNGKAGFYAYECKTCNRCFPSFQALGGHRASHKRPKAGEEKKVLEEENETGDNSLSFQLGRSIPHSKSKMHECSICGAEFSSGQALGGHMRRHRTAIADVGEGRKQRSIISLDLNLPAPEDDSDLSKSPKGFSKRGLVFSASAMVDCHY